MAKSGTKVKMMPKQHGWMSGVRDENSTGAPVHVSSDAQAKENGKNTRQKHKFDSHGGRDALVRPSTSGGPVSSSAKKSLDKRRTRDDLYINPLALHGKDSQFYHLPLPNSQPNLAQMPRSSSLDHNAYPPAAERRMPEPMALQTVRMMVNEDQIGMAIGSPTQQPPGWHPQQAQGNYEALVTSPGSVDAPTEPAANPPTLKRKPSKWKKFGGFFGGKKNVEPQMPFYQVQPEAMSQTSQALSMNSSDVLFAGSSEKSETKDEMKRSKSRSRARTVSDRKDDGRPGMKRANTMPHDLDSDASRPDAMKVHSKSSLDTEPPVPSLHVTHSHKQNPDDSLLLNVEIPKTELERYSIMFGSVLQHEAPVSSSSLLARRQATLEKLKTVSDALAVTEKVTEKEKTVRSRRATSPQPGKSPALSLFPGAPTHLYIKDHDPLPRRPTPLQRSNTSPAALSPSRATFGTEVNENPNPVFPARSTSRSVANGPVYIPKLKVRGRDGVPKNHEATHKPSEETQPYSPESNADNEDDAEEHTRIAVPAITKPVLPEPVWQMVTLSSGASKGAPSISGSMTSRSDTSASKSSTSSSCTTQQSVSSSPQHSSRARSPTVSEARHQVKDFPSPSRKYSEPSLRDASRSGAHLSSHTAHGDREKDGRNLAVAQVSIARKVSVSRGQRQLIVPVKASSPPATGTPARNPNFPSPLHMKHVGNLVSEDASKKLKVRTKIEKGQEVIGGSKSLTPTLVVVGEGEEKQRGRTMARSSPNEPASIEGNTGLGTSATEMQFRRSEKALIERIPSH
ncbi:hypothetical protein F5884DRAFT_755998 [Xylogone sp. PMI_703]|nr:hypothetical protein F5884DRAFT_755998 [Xylogone sp. PMI_703]